jgi:Sulfotransferase domain
MWRYDGEKSSMARNHVLTAKVWHSPRVRWLRQSLSVNRLYRSLSAHRRRLPDYLIVGAQKSGTTSLWEYLNEHPNVEPACTKEMNYFDANYQRGIAWYRSHFSLQSEQSLTAACGHPTQTGESCANYMFHPLAPQRAAETVPDAKIIFLLRNPVDRAFSHYQLKLRRRQEMLSFEEAIDAEPERLAGEEEKVIGDPNYDSPTHNWYSYLARGRYVEQIIRWQQHYRPEKMLILESGEFFKRTADIYQRVLEFLCLPRCQSTDFSNRFPGKYGEKMSDTTRRRLLDYFAPHNERLYAHLGTRFDWDK